MRVLSLAYSTGGISLVDSTQALLELRGTSHDGVWANANAEAEQWSNKTKQSELWTNKTHET